METRDGEATMETRDGEATMETSAIKIVIIYHKSDYDGTLSRDACMAWLPRLHPESQLWKVGWDYGDPEPCVDAYDQVYLVDISIPSVLCDANREKVIWIDHHKTALEKYGDDWCGVRMDGVAACRLTWQWFQTRARGERFPAKADFVNRTVQEPTLLRLAGEYDVWDKRDPEADILQYGLRATPGFDAVRHLAGWLDHGGAQSEVYTLVEAGHIAQRYGRNLNETIACRGHDLLWQGITFHCINTATGNSLTHEAALQPHHQACLQWRWDGQKGRCRVSLYGTPNAPELDLSSIAKARGGGGHRQACGFECSWDEMGEILGREVNLVRCGP